MGLLIYIYIFFPLWIYSTSLYSNLIALRLLPIGNRHIL